MANTTTKVDLVINRMSQSKYEQLKSAGQLNANQIYMTTDGFDPVPDTRKVNGQTLEADVTLTGADIAVSTTDSTKINSALAAKAALNHTHSNYVPTSRTIAGQALSANITAATLATAIGLDNYKPLQTATPDPSASGNSTTFIATITQNANGVITATKKSVNFSGYKPTQTAKSSPTASGNTTSFIDTVSQDTNGVITASKKTITSASTSASGIVQLNDTLTSTSTTLAATANAVKQLNDKFDDYVLLSDLEDGLNVDDIEAKSVTIDGKVPSLEGHTHGNITSDGALQDTDIAIANGDKLVVTDASGSSKVARTSLAFDGSTTTQFLSKKGTWEAPVITGYVSKAELATAIAAVGSIPSGDNANLENTIAKFNLLIQKLTELAS